MGQFHQVEQTKERFADEITGVRVRSIEFCDSLPSEIAIHLSNRETLFVGVEKEDNGQLLGEEIRLCFSKQVFS